MGSAHAVNVTEGRIPGLRLAAVANCEPGNRRWGKRVRCFSSPESLIEAAVVDAVLIATPHMSHRELCVQALKAGLHIMVEKPVSVQKRDAEAICQARVNPSQVMGVMFQQRTNPLYQEIRNIVQRGELGEIRRINWIVTDWFRTENYFASSKWRGTWAGEGGGLLLNQCPHHLDLWQWIFGMPSRVRAFCGFGRYHDIEVEDDVTAYLEYANGTTGVFIASTGESPGSNRLEITGERGRLVCEGGQLHHLHNATAMSAFSRAATAPFVAPPFSRVDHSVADTGGRHTEVMKNFVDAIVRGVPLVAPVYEGISSLELANAMILSAWDNCAIDLPLDGERYARALAKRVDSSRGCTKSRGG